MIVEERDKPETVAAPPIPLYRRPAVYRLVIVALLAEIGYAVLNVSAMGPYLKVERGIGEDMFSLILSAYLLSEAISKSPMGHLADRYGRRFFMSFGPLMSVGTALLSIALPAGNGPWIVFAFVLLRIVDGIGAGMLWPAAFATISDSVADDERQQAMSYLNLCYILGIALALPIGGAVNDLTGHKAASFWLAAGLFACVSLAAYKLVPQTAGTSGPGSAAHGESLNWNDLFNAVKKNPTYVILALATFMGVGAPMPVIKTFPTEEFGLSETAIGALVFPAAISMAVLSVPMTKLGERIGRVRSVHWGIGLCTLGLFTIASGMFLPFMRSPLVLALGGIPAGVGFLLAIPAWYAAVSDIDPQNRGINIGMIMTCQGMGAIVGAIVGGFMGKHTHRLGVALGLGREFGLYMPFACSAVFVMIGWLLSLKILHVERVANPE